MAAGTVMAVSAASCGGGGRATSPATTGTPATPRSEHPLVIRVNGKRRVVTLSKVGFPYCRKRTDVCAAIRGANFRRLSPIGKRAVLQARRRKRARQAAAREAAAREAARREAERQQRYQPPPAPQPQPEGTTTG
jgi:hypothetical protein